LARPVDCHNATNTQRYRYRRTDRRHYDTNSHSCMRSSSIG